MAIVRTHTADEAFALGLDQPFELIDGELHILPGSGQNASAIGSNLLIELGIYLKRNAIGVVTGEGGGYILSRNPDTVGCPDVGFVFNSRLNDGKRHEKFVPHPPDFAIEVMSPSDRRIDHEHKARAYIRAGTTLLWLVDPKTQTVTVFRPDRAPEKLGLTDVISGETVLPGFELVVDQVFKQPGP